MILLAKTGMHYAIYSAAGYGVAFVSSYLLNALFTFRSSPVSSGGFALFLAINGTLLVVVELVQAGLIELVRLPEVVGIIAGAVAYTLTGFVLNRYLVFRAGA